MKNETKKNNTSKNNNSKKIKDKVVVIEKDAKEVIVDKKNEKEQSTNNVIKSKKKKNYFKNIITYKNAIIGFALGLLLGLGIMSTQIPTQIATLKDGSKSILVYGEEGISAAELYESLKDKSNINSVLDLLDAKLLESKYPYEKYNEEAKTESEEMIKYYQENYQMTEADFLSYYGFTDRETFIEFLTLDSQRYDYYHDVLADKISDKDIKKYYEKNVFGPIGATMISVTSNDDSKDDEKLIKEIQSKVNEGSTYKELEEEYKNNSSVTFNDLGYVTFDSGLDEVALKALKKLKKNSHSTKYIESESYGYVILFRTDQKEKEKYEEVDSVIEELLIQEMNTEDPNLFYKTLIQFRKDAGVKFTDTTYEKAYKEYVKSYK